MCVLHSIVTSERMLRYTGHVKKSFSSSDSSSLNKESGKVNDDHSALQQLHFHSVLLQLRFIRHSLIFNLSSQYLRLDRFVLFSVGQAM